MTCTHIIHPTQRTDEFHRPLSIRSNSSRWRRTRFANFNPFQTSRPASKVSLKQPFQEASIPVSFTPPLPFPTQTSRETRVQPPPVGSPPHHLRPRQPRRRVRNSFATLGYTRRRTRRTRRRILLTRRTRTALLSSPFPGPPFFVRSVRPRVVPSAVSTFAFVGVFELSDISTQKGRENFIQRLKVSPSPGYVFKIETCSL